jgi:hypothetical protein
MEGSRDGSVQIIKDPDPGGPKLAYPALDQEHCLKDCSILDCLRNLSYEHSYFLSMLTTVLHAFKVHLFAVLSLHVLFSMRLMIS